MPLLCSSCGKIPISGDEKILTLHYKSRYRRMTEGVLVVDVPAEAMDGDEMTVTIHETGTETPAVVDVTTTTTTRRTSPKRKPKRPKKKRSPGVVNLPL